MYSVSFYCNAKYEEPIRDYLTMLNIQANTDKNSRIKLKKIYEYIDMLKEYGTRAGLPFMKHIEGDIWELRLTSDRIFFFCHTEMNFVLLHHFHKKTQKTPQKEIDQAKRNRQDFLKRATL